MQSDLEAGIVVEVGQSPVTQEFEASVTKTLLQEVWPSFENVGECDVVACPTLKYIRGSANFSHELVEPIVGFAQFSSC